MAFKEVFQSLRELFPQVDLRILKAVAIEHSKDVHAAVEFILYEVSPPLTRAQETTPYNLPDTLETEESHTGEGPEPVAYRSAPGDDHLSPDNLNSSGMLCCASDFSHVASRTTLDDIPSKAHSGDDNVQLICSVKDAVQSLESASSVVEDQVHCLEDNNMVSFDHNAPKFPSSVLERNPYSLEYDTQLNKGINYNFSESEERFVRSSVNSASNQDLNQLEAINASGPFISACDSSSVFEEGLDPVRCIMVFKDGNSFLSEYEAQQRITVAKDARENGAELFPQTDMVSIEAADQHTAVTARSAQVVNADVLEESVIDAKNNKKLLMSAMDSIIDLMKDVELQEERAKQANDAASSAGQDILIKVEELSQMLKHAKEANEMHAGEVYGEKSILATEARELQSRLLSLSDERDRSLTIIEEVRQTLEGRLAAAQKELEASEQEKLEKEELARKALKEQELIMETIVQESKKLQQEAEENSKLREFLMDRGRIVDVLQGEIAVICEDVRSLKHKVDNRLPLNRSASSHASLASSLSSSHHKSISSNGSLASSLSSSHHKSISSNGTSYPVELGERENKQDDCIGQQLTGSVHNEKESNVNTRKIGDDDWELLM